MWRIKRFLYWIWMWIMNKHVNGDVRIVGLVAGRHVIEDIGRDVSFGETILIPAEMALRSVDLWRAISQKCVFRIPASMMTAEPHGVDDMEKARLTQYITELESRLVRLQAENDSLRAKLQETKAPMGDPNLEAKLDTILAAIQSTPKVVHVHGDGPQRVVPKEDVVDGSAPTFLPSEITLKDVETRIDIQGEKSEASGVSEASKALSKLRKGR